MQASPLYGYWFKAVQGGVHYASFYKVGGQAVHDGGTGWRYMMAVPDGGQHTLLPLCALRLVLQGQSTWEDAPRPILPLLHSISLHHQRGAPLCLPTTIANAQRTWEDRMMTRLQFFLPPLPLTTGPWPKRCLVQPSDVHPPAVRSARPRHHPRGPVSITQETLMT